ncbi:MAG TPA: hypothetical protein VNI02_23085 [Blastocatellia bacterium]|nr:hypothetical protein [Blastocatellia bacterium]
MGDFKDEPKKIATRGTTAGVLLYTLIGVGILALVIILLVWAFT